MKTGLLWLGAAVLACALCGCGEDVAVAGPAIVVERWDAAGECFARCPSNSALPAGLELAEQCAAPAGDCALRGGEDTLRVTVDLGDVEVPRATELDPPRLDRILDSEVTVIDGAFAPRVPGTARTSFTGVIDVPAAPAKAFSLRADFGNGFGGESDTYRILEPVVEISAYACEAPCAVEAGTGELSVAISAALGLGDEVVLSTTLDGGPWAPSAEVALSFVDGTRRSGATALDVPAQEGVTWGLRARAGAYSSEVLEVQVLPLSLKVELPDCPVPGNPRCELEGGQDTLLVLSAPRDVVARSAVISTRLDGLVEPATFEIELGHVEGDRRFGSAKIDVPDAPGKTWQVVARLGESVRSGALVDIVPPATP